MLPSPAIARMAARLRLGERRRDPRRLRTDAHACTSSLRRGARHRGGRAEHTLDRDEAQGGRDFGRRSAQPIIVRPIVSRSAVVGHHRSASLADDARRPTRGLHTRTRRGSRQRHRPQRPFYVDQAVVQAAHRYELRDRSSVVVDWCRPARPARSPSRLASARCRPTRCDGLRLVVSDIEAARDDLTGRGTEVGVIFHFGEAGQTSGLDPERRSYATFMPFHDLRRQHLARPGGQARLGA